MVGENVARSMRARTMPGEQQWVPREAYEAARNIHRPALQETFRAYFCSTGVAAIAYPTTLVPAIPIGQDEEVEMRGKKVPLRLAAGLTRDGVPVGIEFDGPAGADRDVLAPGQSLESVIGRPLAPRI